MGQRVNGSLEGQPEDPLKDFVLSDDSDGHGWKYCMFGTFIGTVQDTCDCSGPFDPSVPHTCSDRSCKPNTITWVSMDGEDMDVTYFRYDPVAALRQEVMNAIDDDRPLNEALVLSLMKIRANPSNADISVEGVSALDWAKEKDQEELCSRLQQGSGSCDV